MATVLPPMEINVEETGPVERKLSIQVPTAEVDAAFHEVFREVGKTAHIKGFRRGKVPRNVLEKYYGDRAAGEVLERLVRETLFKAIQEKELDVLGQPRLDPSEHPKQGAAYSYDALVEIRPVIELRELTGLKVVRPQLPIPDEDPVDAHLQQLREGQGQLVEVEAGTTSARGHTAILDYQGFVDGEAFDGGTAEAAQIEIGAGRTIPGFEDNLVGLQAGDEREFQVDFPEDYPAEHLSGKNATFKVKLQELKRSELPELDDEFAKDVSEEFETLDALKADLRRRVEEGREEELKRLERDAVIDAALEAHPFPVPPSLVENQLAERIHRSMQQFGGQLPEEQQRELVTNWMEEWRPQVEREVKVALLVPEIAKAHELEVTPEDIDAHLNEVAEQQGQSVGQIKKTYQERGLMPAIAGGLLEQKAIEFLVSTASLSDA